MTKAKYEICIRLGGSLDSTLVGNASPIIGKYDNFQEKQSCRECYYESIAFPNTSRILH